LFIVNFTFAKLWLFFDYSLTENKILPDGTFDFPNQWFLMHLGLWMNEWIWLWLSIACIITLALLFLTLYKIKFTRNSIQFYKKFEPKIYE
jgi:hypothetical protein